MAAVILENVSKKFILHHDRPRSFQEMFLSIPRREKRNDPEEFWALRDVSFEIAPGTTVGLIGPNGAGKSTLLKLISRIIEPTSGRIQVNGRVGSLLELGAGFHPDLTGRENIYLNGSILGLSQAQIRCKLDEIIAFAELERFIDVPVRHYSSGMYVRLGFSVAVHTDPEILLVDEVLAVGDAAFQQKCLEKMAQFKREGRTILFVSHALHLIEQLCTKAIWFEEGKIQQIGDAHQVLASYMKAIDKQIESELSLKNAQTAPTTRGEKLRIRNVTMLDAAGKPCWTFRSGDPVHIRILYEATERIEKPIFSILIHRSDGLYVSSTNTYNINPFNIGPIQGAGELVVAIAALDLYEGDYLLSVGAYLEPDPPYWSAPADFLDKQYRFRMLSPNGAHGVLVLPAKWEHYPGSVRDTN
jgi:ABC-type polysaccharide/polyol phosphate transport system ATPase subunit